MNIKPFIYSSITEDFGNSGGGGRIPILEVQGLGFDISYG